MLRFAPLLVCALVAGFLVGGCGGGGGTALTTGTRTLPSVPARTEAAGPILTQITTSVLTTVDVTTVELTTEAETTVEVTTVVPEPVTTTAILTVTTTPPQVETAPATPVTTVAQTETAEPVATSSNDNLWWLAFALVFLAGVVLLIVLWGRRRGSASSWRDGMGNLRRRSLVAIDDVVANGSLVTGRIQALAAEAAALEAHAPGDAERAASARLRASLDGLAETLETDRMLRLNSPPPSTEQLEYSTARIRRQAQELQGVLRPPEAGGAYAR